MTPDLGAQKTALVLGSGGARAAYEVGVARFLFEDLQQELGRGPEVKILCGSSAGALNALGLATFAERPASGVAFLAHRWAEMELRDFIRPQFLEIFRLGRTLLGCPPAAENALQLGGGILDAGPFRRKVLGALPRTGLRHHFEQGHLLAVSFTTTEIATGRTVLFVETEAGVPSLSVSRGTRIVRTRLTPAHAFASAAIPLLFDPVRIQGRAYCDGSLRQSVPLSPALQLGAERVVAVSTQHLAVQVPPLVEHERERSAGNPLYLLGKAINSLTLDRIDDDLERLDLINALLEAGQSAFGDDFGTSLNRELERGGHRAVRPVRVTLVRPSQSLGAMAADYVRSRTFKRRNRDSVGRLFARLAEGESEHEADLLSYLLFDGVFAEQLMTLGYGDARRQRKELMATLTNETRQSRAA